MCELSSKSGLCYTPHHPIPSRQNCSMLWITDRRRVVVKKRNKETVAILNLRVTEGKTPNIPMLYTNRPKSPPRTDRPMVDRESSEYEAAAPLLPDDFGPEEVLVPEVIEVGSSVAETQLSFPCTTFPSKAVNLLQSMVAVLWMFKAP